MMDTLDAHVKEYTAQLAKGHIQVAYRGILGFMSDLRAHLEQKHPDYAVGSFYPGYMDMTYFAFTPPSLRDQKLKIAIVYLHEENRFEGWLAAANRQVQAQVSDMLREADLGRHTLTELKPGVDAIIGTIIVSQPSFADPISLENLIERETLRFIGEMQAILAL